MKFIKDHIRKLPLSDGKLTEALYSVDAKQQVIINRLKQLYKETLTGTTDYKLLRKRQYNAMRLFCLDCELVSFNDIELMESEVKSSFSS